MARRGVFGRLPRAQPSLTSTIISIAEQMLAEQDRNIMEAWQNGGTYEGKPVTDDMVLKHWQQRLAGVGRSDPLYDTYKNNVTQLRYKIAYSKQYTRYLQGGRTDNMGMARFFQEWAQKIPRNSEFYRQLQQDAAGYVNLARSAARAGAAQAKVANFNARRTQIERQYIQPATFINATLDNYARANGLIGQGQSIEYLTPEGTAKFYDLLANADKGTFLYSAPNGRPVTVGDVRQRIGQMSPHLKFGMTADDIQRINLQGVKGSTMAIRLARNNGYSDWESHYQQQRNVFGQKARESGIMSVEDQYVQAREQFNVDFNDPNTGVEDKAKAWETYHETLSGLAMSTTDANTRARLFAEASGDSTQNSLAEDVFGFGKQPDLPPGSLGAAPPNVSDIANEQMQVRLVVEQQQLATDGTGMWTKGTIVPVTNSSGQTVGYQFRASPTGTVVGLTNDPAVIQSLLTAPVVTLPSVWGGLKDVRVQWMPVNVKGLTTATVGNSAPSTLVAEAATIVVNGVEQTSYRYVNGGHTWITPYAPWSSALPVTHNPDGSITVDATGLFPTGGNAVLLAQQHPELYRLKIAGVEGAIDPSGLTQNADGTYTIPSPTSEGQTLTIGPGQFIEVLTTDPASVLRATDATRAAGPSPTEDFQSLTQSMLVASPGGQAEWDKLSQDPAFQQRIHAEIVANTTDPRTGYSNPVLQAAANLQAFGNRLGIPGLQAMADSPMGHQMFSFFVNQSHAVNPNIRDATPVAAGVNASAQAQVSHQRPEPFARPTPEPVQPTLANVGSYANDYNSLVRMGLVPAPAVTNAPQGGHEPVTIAPVNIRVPQPPPPEPIRPMPAPAPTPVTPVYGPPLPTRYIYGQQDQTGHGGI